ncbi:MAG TPA: GAF domain-containing protein [Anaerolineales bacterium]|nr:GAF domain-containing protein [Anaerolineales bacterium]
MEQRVADRTREIALASAVGRNISQVRDLDTLLAEAVELIRSRFNLYYTQIYLVDPSGQSLILRSGTGAVGHELVRRGFRLTVGAGSINGAAAAEHRAVIVADTAGNPAFRPNSLLPDTRSEMAVPLILGDQVVGVLDMQSSQAGTFSEENLPAFETLAGQLAVAIENATLFAQTEQSRAELEEQTRRLTRSAWQDFLNAINSKERIVHTYEPASLQPAPADSLASPVASSLSAPITIAGEPVGLFRLEGESNRAWTETEAELVNAVAGQVARQIENIRLLAQADQYRTAAEEAARRLTRQGWADYSELLSANAYVYDGEQVSATESVVSVDENARSRPIIVQGAVIGDIIVDGTTEQDDEASAAILESVAAQLSAHLENLRLTHQTRIALADTQILYETSARLNAANSLEETLNIAAGPGIGVGASDALLFVFDLDAGGKPEWMEVRANWASTGAIALPVGVRFYIPSYPLSRLFINNPDEIILIDDIEHSQRVDSRLRTIFEQTQLKALVAMPLTIGGRWVGLIIINWTAAHKFNPADAQLYKSLATQAAIVVDNRILFDQTQAALAESRQLYDASRRLAASVTLQEILATLVESVPISTVNRAVLMSYERAAGGNFTGALVAANWHSGRSTLPTEIGTFYPADAFKTLKLFLNTDPAFFDDVQNDPRVEAATRSVFAQQNTRGAALLPLWVTGRQLGIVVIQCEEPHHFDESEIRPYTSLAQQLAIAVENRRLFEQTQVALADSEDQARRLAQLNEMNTQLNSAASLDDIIGITLSEIQKILDSDGASVTLITESGNAFEVFAMQGEPRPTKTEGVFELAGTAAGVATAEKRTLVIADTQDSDLRDVRDMARRGMRSMIQAPLVAGNRALGTLVITSRLPSKFTSREANLMQQVAAIGAAAIENRRLFEQTEQTLTETQTLYNVSAQLNAATTVHEILFAVVQAAISSDMSSAVLRAYEMDELGQPALQILKAAWAVDSEAPILKAPLGSALNLADFPFAQFIAHSTSPVLCKDIFSDPRVDAASRESLSSLGVRTAAFLPLVYGGQRLGYIRLAWDQLREFSATETRLFNTLSVQAAVAINNRVLFEQAQKRAERETIINVINQKIQSATSVESAIQTAVRELGQIFKARRAVVELSATPERNNGH